MIVKECDASGDKVAWLERMELMESDLDQRRLIYNARKRLRSTSPTEHACDVLKQLFASSPDWMLLHDLRLVNDRQVTHANHVLVNNALEFFVIDSRYINYGLSISEGGSWRVHTADENGVIASPLSKLNRDVRYLKNYLKDNDLLPSVFGIKRPVSVHGYVLVSPSIRSSKAVDCGVDATQVVSADNLFRLIWKESDHWLNKRIQPVKPEVLRQLAHKLAKQHQPTLPMQLSARAARPARQPLPLQSSALESRVTDRTRELLQSVSYNASFNS